MKELDIKWLQEYAEQEKRYKWGKQIKLLLTAYEKEKGENVKLRLQDIPLIEGELKVYKDRVSELKAELEKEKEKNKELSDKLTEKICKGVEEEILEEYRQIIIDKNKIIEELKKYKK